MKQRFLNTFVVMCSIFASSATYAQPQCDDWQKLSDALQNEHGEHFVAGWLMSEDVILQFWASDEARTWTILRVSTDGTACITSYGQDWILGIPDAPGEDL